MSRALKRLVDFWTLPISPQPLALFRISFGTTILLSCLLSMGPYLNRYLGPEALCPADKLDRWLRDNYRFCPIRGPMHIPFLDAALSKTQKKAWAAWGEHPRTIQRLFLGWMVAIFCMTTGFCTRPATIVAWALTVTFHNRLSWVLNGGDALFRTGLFYLMFAPAGAAWSLDNVLWRRTSRPVPAWPVRLMQIQFCLIYLATGLSKLNDDWFRGLAVYWVLNDVAVARWPYCRVPVPLFLCQIASWGTILFEIGFPFLVWSRRVRPWLLLAGVGLHGSIWATTEVGWFSQITLCWYVLFLSQGPAERCLLEQRHRRLTPSGSPLHRPSFEQLPV